MRTSTRTRASRRQLRRGGLGLLAAAAAAGALLTAGAGQALAEGHPTAASAQAIQESGGAAAIANQDALSQFRAWMFARPGFGASGYVGTIDNPAKKATAIMWYGPSSPLLKSILAEGTRRGIKVTVQHRKYSLQQLQAATESVLQQAAAGKWAGFKISAVEALSAADDGITVDGTYTSAPAAGRAPQVRSLTTQASGVPVQVVPGVSGGTADGRDADYQPFDSGDYMITNTEGPQNSIGQTCSTGFSVTLNGGTYVTTARHCGYEGSVTKQDYVARDYYQQAAPSKYHYGNVTEYTDAGADGLNNGGGAVLGQAPGAARMYHDGYNSTGDMYVIGYEPLGVGDMVCTEGGNSGEHCNVKVTNLLVGFNDGDGSFETIEGVQQTAGQIAVIQGDSGGPVMSLVNTPDTSPRTEVRAAGMIQGYLGGAMTGAACGAVYDAGGNVCSANVLFSSMQTVVNGLPGASLATAP